MKKVSVIVPCYKYARFLKECIDSLRNQTYKNIEIIVVSDGSPDNTVEVSKELGVRCIEKENGGLSSARNAGIKEATGELIMCLDADDKLVPAAIEEHVKLITDDKTVAQCALMHFGKSHDVYTPRQGTTYETLLYGNTVFCNAMFPRKAWVESRCGYDESDTMRLGLEDYLFWLDLARQGYRFNTSDFIALRYRQHDNNMTKETTHPNWPKILDYMRTIHSELKAK